MTTTVGPEIVCHIFALYQYSIQTWALEEARRRLEAEGILPDPDKPSTTEQR
jgi:hypothetical protein